jgi:hypothetical protein
MDIDTETPIDSKSLFSIVLPLPYRCLLLVGIGILGWATNLHGLYFLGVDTGYTLNIRRSSFSSMDNVYENLAIPTAVSSSRVNRGTTTFARPSTLYGPIYKIFITYGVLVFTSWLLFRLLSGDSPDEMDSSKIIPSLTFLAVLVSLFWPFSFAQKQERYTFLRCADLSRTFHKLTGFTEQRCVVLFPRSLNQYTSQTLYLPTYSRLLQKYSETSGWQSECCRVDICGNCH